MRWMTAMLIVMGVTAAQTRSAVAQQPPAELRAQVTAANSRALDRLRAQIASEPIGPGLTVHDLLDRTGSGRSFTKTVRRAQQIGGPRWIDDETCQVRLEISGGVLAQELVKIATLSRLESPVPPEVLAGRLRDWNGRTFSATGTSTGAAAVETIGGDDAGRKGVCDARNNAVAQTINAIKPITLANGKTVGDALAEPAVGQEIEKWLAERPVTQVDYPDAAHVRVQLAASPDALFETFRSAAAKQQKVSLPGDENEWSRVREEFALSMTPAAMRGSAKTPAAPAGAAPVAHAFIDAGNAAAPDWADRQMDAQGVGTARGSQLKAARAAEADAANNLRAKLGPLTLPKGVTIEQAVRQDKGLENALDRALLRAKTTRTEYQSDGNARVDVQLDLRDVWAELASSVR